MVKKEEAIKKNPTRWPDFQLSKGLYLSLYIVLGTLYKVHLPQPARPRDSAQDQNQSNGVHHVDASESRS